MFCLTIIVIAYVSIPPQSASCMYNFVCTDVNLCAQILLGKTYLWLVSAGLARKLEPKPLKKTVFTKN